MRRRGGHWRAKQMFTLRYLGAHHTDDGSGCSAGNIQMRAEHLPPCAGTGPHEVPAASALVS